MKDLEHWLVLAGAPGIGATDAARLIERFGDLRTVVSATPRDLKAAGIADADIAALRDPDRTSIAADMEWAGRPGRQLLTLHQPDFPERLAALPQAPRRLYLVGDNSLLDSPQLAIVGSRNPTSGGRETAHAFAAHLARCGLTITSGLAMGVDASAHAGALDAGEDTIAVLGTGADRIYPAVNEALARRIAEHGLLVSEYPPGTPPRREHFPQRNRIIAGLSLGVLVVEAAQRSGSLITARLAGELGREVFAIPGSIHNPMARGCHRLIRQGAKLVETADDVIEELAPQLQELLTRPSEALSDTTSHTATEEEDPEYSALLEALGHDPTSVDQVVDRTGLTVDVVSSMLLLMELQGQVETTHGGRYMRVTERS